MNKPTNPIIPPGSVLELKNHRRNRVRLAVFFVLAVHVVGLLGLLMVGCRKPVSEEQPMDVASNAAPMMDSTNVPAAPTNEVQSPPAAAMSAASTPALPAGSPTEYTVVSGDNFTTIGKKFGVTVRMIQDANPAVDPKRLQIGQKLQIPVPSAASSTAPPPGSLEMGAAGEQTYTVKSGDTLTKIANDFGTTIKVIRSANNLTTDKIIVGQRLKIPAKAPAAPAAAPGAPANPAM